ncbi:MAG TPA: type II toxin-antitoxin system VapC family toxin [Gemmataceae bacterium]
MRFLIDTQVLIWSQDNPGRLSASATTVLTNSQHDLSINVATAWEIGIKVSIGKLSLAKPFRSWIETAVIDLRLTVSPIGLDLIGRQIALPFHHRDPFDRMLAAQALVECIPIVSIDSIFDSYGVTRIWT